MDVLEDRPRFEPSAKMLSLIQEKKFEGCISAITIPILWFLAEKSRFKTDSKKVVSNIIKGFSIISLDEAILNKAFESNIDDFEDALQLYSAIKGKCDCIITWNKKDFGSPKEIGIQTPEEFLGKVK
jgi:predicted nucleic acid-binding protein